MPALPLDAPFLAACAVASLAVVGALLARWRDLTPVVVVAASTALVGGLPLSPASLVPWAVVVAGLMGSAWRARPRSGPLRVALALAAAVHLVVGLGHALELAPASAEGAGRALGVAFVGLAFALATWRASDPVPVRWIGRVPVEAGPSDQGPTTSS